jgi:glycolate oxidase FAD binding subunit
VAAVEPSRIEEAMRGLLDANRVRVPRGQESLVAQTVVEPRDADEICEIVRRCEAGAITLAPMGAARTLAEVRRTPVALGVSLVQLNRIVGYEPEDMTLIVEPGITLGALNAHLAAHGQRLPLDPYNPDMTTIGALIGAARAGPLRLSEGTPRDLLIGVRFVGHGGRLVHGGGRVVKNVAGYDLMKVMTGSFGTLGVITEATFKVRPIPEGYTIVVASHARADDAFAAALKLHDALPLVHVEILSPGLAVHFGHPGAFLMLAGIAGNAPELAYQCGRIAELVGGAGFVGGADATDIYVRLRDVGLVKAALEAQLATPPAELSRCIGAIGAEFRAHAASGVAQILEGGAKTAVEARETLARWREAAHAARGHLQLLSAAPELRAHLDFFDEPPAGALKLMRRLKASFDPAGIFNPGCFVAGL